MRQDLVTGVLGALTPLLGDQKHLKITSHFRAFLGIWFLCFVYLWIIPKKAKLFLPFNATGYLLTSAKGKKHQNLLGAIT